MTAPERSLPVLGHAEAKLPPCDACEAYCCTLLALYRFRASTVLDIDHAYFVLNFADIELGLSRSMEWTVYLRKSCSHLVDRRCAIYGQPERPYVCEAYNPVGCWYKRVFSVDPSPLYLRVDRRRMDIVTAHLGYDENREIVAWPPWEQLVDAFERDDAAARASGDGDGDGGEAGLATEAPAGEPGLATEAPAAEAGTRLPVLSPSRGLWQHEPCETCEAHCCKLLVFRQDRPNHLRSLDYFYYALQFPGVTLGITDRQWYLIVRTTCRHLEGTRCGVFGQPERPNWCTFYDAWQCAFKPRFGGADGPADGFVEASLTGYEAAARLIEFGDDGRLVAMPDLEAVRSAVLAAR